MREPSVLEVFAGQVRQKVWPGLGWYVPGRHGVQEVSEVLPDWELNVPEGQRTGSDTKGEQ